MYSLKVMNRQSSKKYWASATEVEKPRIKLEKDGVIEYISLEEREKEGSEVGFFVSGKLNFPAKPKPVMDGLICWLDGRDGSNEEQTNVWVDRSGSGNNATFSNLTFDSVSGWTGEALRLDGARYGTITGNSGNCFINDAEFTVSFCFQNNGTNNVNQSVISGSHLNNWYCWIKPSGSLNPFCVWISKYDVTTPLGAVTISKDLTNSKSVFTLVVSKTSKTVQIYFDDVLLKTVSGIEIYPFSVTNILVGTSQSVTSNYFKGDIFSIKFYNRALTSEEVNHNYNCEMNK